MRKFLGVSLILLAVAAFTTVHAFARGGGHGGGHHGGGHHGGHHAGHHSSHHHSSHHHSSHHHTGHHSHHGSHYHHSNWAHHNRPFSRGWYGRHGGNWGYGWGGWGWGNPWGIATWGTTAAWLGLDAAAEPIVGNYGTVPQYYTSDEATDENTTENIAENENNESTDNETPQTETSATETNNEAELNAPAGNAADEAGTPDPEQAAQAGKLAKSGATDPAKDTAFLPLGVFSLAPQGQTEASALVQLAISKTSIVRGTYYDLLTDQDHPIRGAVDKKSQQVAFTFGEQGKVVFETSLANLTQKEGSAAAHFENGEKRTWILARYEKEPTEETGKGEPSGEKPQVPAAPQTEAAVQ